MDGIDIVATDNILDHRTDERTALGQSWVEIELVVIFDKPFGMLAIDVLTIHRETLGGRDAIWVDPRMELHLTVVAELDHIVHRIPQRHRCFALLACEKTAPRLVVALVESIALGANLEDHGIEARLMKHIDQRGEIGLALFGCHALVAVLPSSLNPRTTEISLAIEYGSLFFLLAFLLCVKVQGHSSNKNQGKKEQSYLFHIFCLF